MILREFSQEMISPRASGSHGHQDPSPCTVADPGFPVGGRGPVRGVWTPNVGTFWQKCMQKRKNWVLYGGGHAPSMPPLDPPMMQKPKVANFKPQGALVSLICEWLPAGNM